VYVSDDVYHGLAVTGFPGLHMSKDILPYRPRT
jgi:hypothetical protein